MSKKTDAQRKEIVDYMIANCECWEEGDREVLNAMSDEKLTSLRAHVENHKNIQAVANAARQGFEHGDVGFTFNEKDLRFEGKKKPEPKKDPPAPTINEEKKPQTADEWLAAAPAEVQSVVRNALETERRQKEALIKVITANKANQFKPEQLATKSLDDLTAIAALAQVPETKPSFFGASVPATNQAADVVEPLMLPVVNWNENKT